MIFYLAVQSRDLKVLTKLPGIGKMTAERLLLELKDKVGGIGGDSDSSFADTAFGGGSAAVDEAMKRYVLWDILIRKSCLL